MQWLSSFWQSPEQRQCDGLYDEKTAQKGFGPILYNRECYDEETKSFKLAPAPGTVIDIFKTTVTTYGDRRGAGKRILRAVHKVEENGNIFDKLEYANEITWLTYNEYYHQVCLFSRGLHVLGATPRSRLVIFAETQLEWLLVALGCFLRGVEVVTAYATLGAQGLACAVYETQACSVVVDARLLPVLISILPQIPDVRHVITLGKCRDEDVEKIEAAGVEVVAFTDVLARGNNEIPLMEPAAEDIAVIMYTSGTTGKPKGVRLTHGNLAPVVVGFEKWILGMYDIYADDLYLAYLPLAHIMEFAGELAAMGLGIALGYGTPHTLTESGVKLKKPESISDAVLYQPTMMNIPPAIVDKVYQAIHAKFESQAITQWLFSLALASGKDRFEQHQSGMSLVWHLLIGKKLQAILGGRLRGIVSGSSFLAQDARIFMQTVIGCPLVSGYGLTETGAGGCLQLITDESPGVGPPAVTSCIRLADWPEGNYLVADEKNPKIGMPRGEILIGGDSVSSGYFIDPRNPDQELVQSNKESVIELDGYRFFRTGDIGQITNGRLSIIDRKKDLWKGPNGEYVALAKVELALKLSKYIDLCMCYGKFGGAYPVALLCVNASMTKQFASDNNLKALDDLEALCTNEMIITEVTKSVVESCKRQKLAAFEIPRKFALISDTWTPENELLTPAMKLKRLAIADKYRAEIDAMV